MASCYDCIHCGACSDAGDSGFSSLKEDVSMCKHFKNKENFAEVKYGEWIEDGYNDIPCVCSRCGSEAPYKADCREDYDYDYDDNLIFLGAEIEKEYIKTPYCPYCGADMSGVTDCHE